MRSAPDRKRPVTDSVDGIESLTPVVPSQDARPVGEFLVGVATDQRPSELTWSPAGDEALTRDDSPQQTSLPGERLQTVVPVDSGAGNGSSTSGSAAPSAVLSPVQFDVPGGSWARFALDSSIPSSISQTVPVPPG